MLIYQPKSERANNNYYIILFWRAALIYDGRSTSSLNSYVPLNHHKKLPYVNLTPPMQPNSDAYILRTIPGKSFANILLFRQWQGSNEFSNHIRCWSACLFTILFKVFGFV